MNLDKGLSPETIAITAGRPTVGPDSSLNHPISLNSTFVAGGAVGYGRYGNETWLALSNLFFGTMLGTVASFAGDQKSVKHSTKIVAVYNQK